jgi:hypothetical protein
MDMMDDDDFMGEIELDLSPEQQKMVSRAIDLAASDKLDSFGVTNPLIAIMQWWETNVPDAEKPGGPPEATLAEACRLFVLAHDKRE